MSFERTRLLRIVKLELILIRVGEVGPHAIVDACINIHMEATVLIQAAEEIRKEKFVMFIDILVDDLDILSTFAAAKKSERHTGLSCTKTIKSVQHPFARFLIIMLHSEREIKQERCILALCHSRLRCILLFPILLFTQRLCQLLQRVNLTGNVLIEQLANHWCLAGVTCEEDVYLPYITSLERRRHRLEEIIHTAPYTVFKCPLKFFHIDVQADVCTISCIPCLLRREQGYFCIK